MNALVRPYAPEDREAVYRIAADTAYFGDPVEEFLPDRQFLLDVFVSYYLDSEPEHAWVAEVDGEVAGYLTASTGGPAAAAGQVRAGLRASGRLLGGSYNLGDEGREHLWRTVLAKVRGEYPAVDESVYPAHLHVNLAPEARGHSLGRRLIEACLGQMAQLGVPGLHLNTTNLNQAAVRLYEKMGFELLARRQTRLWEPHKPGVEVYHLAYGRRITEADLAFAMG
jgi:ribosomal protein S18 acetylase RimI-like enzyme